MKMRHLYIIVLSVMFAFPALSQNTTKAYNGQIGVMQHLYAQKGDSLIIRMDIDLSKLDVPSTRELELIPALKADSLGKILPSILVRGKHKQREARRMYSLSSELAKADAEAYYVLCTTDAKDNSVVHYRTSVLFETWMANAQLILIEDLCGCAGAKQQMGAELLAKQVLLEKRFDVSPLVAYVTPEAEAVKARSEQSKAYLDFQVGKSAILPEFRNNPRELSKIRRMIEAVKDNQNVTVKSITVMGNASPDGSETSNKRLSEARAQALVDYLRGLYDFDRQVYHYIGAGEDWGTLRALVDSSFISNKEQIIAVIDQPDALDAKETKLKKLNGGRTYSDIKEIYYPLLRRTDCKMEYAVRGFSPEEGREIVKSTPSLLSLNEMFLVANTYEKGSEEFNDIFDIAARIYPDNQVANLNAAAASIERNEMASARKYIARAGELPASYNNLGVMEMLEGNWEAAERLLKKSQELGCKEAGHNLEQLRLKLENNKLFEFVGEQSIK